MPVSCVLVSQHSRNVSCNPIWLWLAIPEPDDPLEIVGMMLESNGAG